MDDLKYSDHTSSDNSRLRIWQKVMVGISIIILFIGAVMFLRVDHVKNPDYTKKYDTPSALVGDTCVVLYQNKIYAYSEIESAVNVFDENDSFEYSVCVPKSQNGRSYFYIFEDNMFLVSRDGKTYRYNMDGSFISVIDETEIPAGAVYEDYYSTVTAAGHEYSILMGVLYKDDKVIYATPFFKWDINMPFMSWITMFVGQVTAMLQIFIYKCVNRKRGSRSGVSFQK